MADGKGTARIATIGGVVAIATGVVGLAGSSLGLLDRFTGADKKGKAPAEERLDNLPRVIDGYLSGPAAVDLWADTVWCADYDAASSSCTGSMALTQRGARNVRTGETWTGRLDYGTPLANVVAADPAADGDGIVGYGHDETAEYEITRRGLCATNAKLAEGAMRAEPWVIAADATDYYALSDEAKAEFRKALAAEYSQAAVGGRQCWRYRLVEGEPRNLISDTFIDDVLQPDSRVTFTLLPKDAPFNIRAPEA